MCIYRHQVVSLVSSGKMFSEEKHGEGSFTMVALGFFHVTVKVLNVLNVCNSC